MKEYICIVCPNSCTITVNEGTDGIKLSGEGCKRGLDFATNEHTNPQRMLTSTVLINGSSLNRLPVISSGEISKSKVFEALAILRSVEVVAPVVCGDIIVSNICDTGENIIASCTMNSI